VSAPSQLSVPASVRTNARAGQPSIPPFWQRLNAFFLFPFQTEPLILAAVLSLAGYVALFPFFLAIPGVIVIVLMTARYAFKIAALAARGVLRSSEYPVDMDPSWASLPWALFGVLVVHGIIIGLMARGGAWLFLLANLVSSLLLPATVVVLIRTGRMWSALNPLELLAAIADIGKQYLLLWLFLFLLQGGMPLALRLLMPVVPEVLRIPASFFVAIYFSWVMAAMTGYVMYQHHAALAIEPLKQPETTARDTGSVRALQDQQARQRDAVVADLVRDDQFNEALAQAREWIRTTEQPVIDHRRYHRLLLLDAPVSGRLAQHTPRYVSLLLAKHRKAEALSVLQAVQRKLPDFKLDDASAVVALAEQACKTMDERAVINLLRSFDKRFPQAPEIPKAYELIIRALKQGYGRGDKALPVYRAMLRRFPDHPATREAQWVLREELAVAQPDVKATPNKSVPS
jgi:hypothetical protein